MEQHKENPATLGDVDGALGKVLRDAPDNTPGGEAEQAAHVPVTVLTSTKPKYLTKRISLQDGKVAKEGGGVMVSGSADVREVDGLAGFAELLTALEPNQATAYGLPVSSPVDVVTKEAWKEQGKPDGVIPRTKDHFHWPDGPAVAMLDYDPEDDGTALSRDELIAAVRDAVPGLVDAQMLWCPSASSFIFNADTREQVQGLRGQRLYFIVADGRDVPRAGKALCEHLWAAGHGRYDVSKAGRLNDRPLIDASVWQTNRLDFAAGAMCEAPLYQDRGEPLLIEGAAAVVNTATAIPDPSNDIKQKAKANRTEARAAKVEKAAQVKAQWVESRVDEMVGKNATTEARENARQTVVRALEYDALSGDFIIHVIEKGQPVAVTVGEVLDDKTYYHGMLTLDPIEPDYRGESVVGKLYLLDGRPNLFSFAHGNKSYRLHRQPKSILITKGNTTDAVDQAIDVLHGTPDVYNYGELIALIDGGKLHAMDDAGLAHTLGGRIQFYKHDAKADRQDCDPPPQLVRQVLSVAKRGGLKHLDAVVTAPTLRPDGSVLATPGYDERSKLLFACKDEIPFIPSEPTRADVVKALDALMYPFHDFPLCGPDDWGVLLAALLTCVARPALKTSPAFGFDAPAQGSGKTLLAECCYILATGEDAVIWPHQTGSDDETRKRLFTALRKGARVMVWDNVVGVFDSAAMSGLLTSENYTDRQLGQSESTVIPNRSIVILTGNNLTVSGDMNRRVLACRIDPKMEAPHLRQFDLNPKAYVKDNRLALVAAALTVLRGYRTSGAERADGRLASFEDWSDLIRQAVVWVGRDVAPGQYGDPVNVVVEAYARDPELETLGDFLRTWFDLYGDKWMSSVEVLHGPTVTPDDMQAGLQRAAFLQIVADVNNGHEIKSPRSLGRVLTWRVGRVVDGLVLEGVKDTSAKAMRWRVVAVG